MENRAPLSEAEIKPVKESRPKTWRPVNWDKMHNRAKAKWFNRHRREIEKDIIELGHLQARKEWGISEPTMRNLRKRWGLPKEPSSSVTTPKPVEKKRHNPSPAPGEFFLLITEFDLARLDDDQFKQQWHLLGTIIKNRSNCSEGETNEKARRD